ncbi:hypothetical protein ACFV3E_24435 [Streptomyces sp. NPDC059718]
MHPEPTPPVTPARSAAAVNRDIRALSVGRSVWTARELEQLAALRQEWLIAQRTELVTAA